VLNHLWRDGGANTIIYTTEYLIGVSPTYPSGHSPDGSVNVRFRSVPPRTYTSETNSRSGIKHGGMSTLFVFNNNTSDNILKFRFINIFLIMYSLP